MLPLFLCRVEQTNMKQPPPYWILDYMLAFSTSFGFLIHPELEPSYWFFYLVVTWLTLDIKSLVDVKLFGY